MSFCFPHRPSSCFRPGPSCAMPRWFRFRSGKVTCSTMWMQCSRPSTRRTKLILIINPNNPTGVFIDDADLIRFCETGVPLCVDEAYLDYNPDRPSKAPLIKKYPQVFLSVTFSKAYGFAGIRLRVRIGHRRDDCRLQSHVSALERQP